MLLRRETPCWTDEQLIRLPDGIRESTANHILLEFKYTESVNETVFQQTLSYDYFYKNANKLTNKQVQSFLMSAKTPRKITLDKFSYRQGKYKGVYFTKMPLLRHINLIVLNELSNDSHNAWIKCFASHRLEKQKAFKVIKTGGLKLMPLDLDRFLLGLWRHWFNDEGEFKMSTELTSEKVMEMGKFWGESYLSLLNPKERLAGLNAKERVDGLNVKERMTGLSIEELETYLQQIKSSNNE